MSRGKFLWLVVAGVLVTMGAFASGKKEGAKPVTLVIVQPSEKTLQSMLHYQ